MQFFQLIREKTKKQYNRQRNKIMRMSLLLTIGTFSTATGGVGMLTPLLFFFFFDCWRLLQWPAYLAWIWLTSSRAIPRLLRLPLVVCWLVPSRVLWACFCIASWKKCYEDGGLWAVFNRGSSSSSSSSCPLVFICAVFSQVFGYVQAWICSRKEQRGGLKCGSVRLTQQPK